MGINDDAICQRGYLSVITDKVHVTYDRNWRSVGNGTVSLGLADESHQSVYLQLTCPIIGAAAAALQVAHDHEDVGAVRPIEIE